MFSFPRYVEERSALFEKKKSPKMTFRVFAKKKQQQQRKSESRTASKNRRARRENKRDKVRDEKVQRITTTLYSFFFFLFLSPCASRSREGRENESKRRSNIT